MTAVARFAIPVAGAVAMAAAFALRGHELAGVASAVAACAASAGIGFAFERVAGTVSTIRSVVSGLAILVVVASALALVGFASQSILLGLIVVGIALSALPRSERKPEPRGGLDTPFAGAVIGVVGSLLAFVAIARGDSPMSDGIDHVFAIKRLLDTGALEPTASPGGIVGGALFGWGTGAAAASLFEAVVCSTLLLVLIARELVVSDRSTARILFGAIAMAILVDLDTVDQPAGTLFHLAAFLALRSSSRGHAIVAALALGTIRQELWFLALPYLVGAVGWPHTRPRALLVGGIWIVATFAIQMLLAIPLGLALTKCVLLLGAFPLGYLFARLIGVELRSPLGIACLAGATFLLAVVTYAAPPLYHDGAATAAAWLGLVFALLVSYEAAASLRIGAVAIVLAVFVSTTLLLPPQTHELWRIRYRFTLAVSALRERMALGGMTAHAHVAAMQQKVPAGEPIAFWGRSGAELDFTRNPIHRISDARPDIAPRSLGRARYLILEDLPSARYDRRTRKTTYYRVIEPVESSLEFIASSGGVHVYRIR